MKKILAAITGLVLALGLAVGFAAPASAGNGTSNFYLTGSCNATSLGVGGTLKFTNYDNGANQVYHTSVTKSGPAVVIDGVYLDGVKKGSSTGELFIAVPGHGPHFVSLTVHVPGFPYYKCNVWK